jgi:hypothetical protein
MLKKGDVVSDADENDDVRTSASQKRVTAIMFMFWRLQTMEIIGLESKKFTDDIQTPTPWLFESSPKIAGTLYRQSQLTFSFQPNLHCRTGFTKPIQLFCNQGKGIKPIFSFLMLQTWGIRNSNLLEFFLAIFLCL